jgi:hypothetical protein
MEVYGPSPTAVLGSRRKKLRLDTEVGAVVSRWNWKPVFGIDAPGSEHINIKELKACRFLVKRAARGKRSRGRRMLLLLDSSVCVGAIGRGRSSSRQINFQLRKLLPYCDAGRIYPLPLWIPTKSNPTDPLSRGEGAAGLYRWLRQTRAYVRQAQSPLHVMHRLS